MRRTQRVSIISALVLTALVLGACQPIAQPARLLSPELQVSPELQGLRPDAPEYARHGPHWVGYKPLLIGEETDHPIQASLWYPALNPTGAEEKSIYTINTKIPVEGFAPTEQIYGRALLDAQIDASSGPYPLVVYSHGFAANAAWASAVLEHLASHGFMVIAPEHTEQFDFDWSEVPNASIDRPRDIKQTLDFAEQASAPGGELAGLIDIENVAMVGHSYGGYTALAMAGAQYDLDAFNARCAALASDDPYQFICAPIVQREAEMAARAGLKSMPEGLWPSFGDPRVKAILPIAGDSYLFDEAGLAKITVPLMAIGGTADTGTPFDWGAEPAYTYASSPRKSLIRLEGGEHFLLASCNGMPWWSETPFYEWVCFDPVWDKERSIDLINHFATAFLLAELKGDPAAATALAPENVSFPGIQYESTGYESAPAVGNSTLDSATVAELELLVNQRMLESGSPGFALGVIKDGAIVYLNGFGLERAGSVEPVTTHSVFGTGSVGKTATATALMQLVEAGKVDLDAQVTDYLPYFELADERYKEITVRHLVAHRSGMPDVAEWFPSPVEYDDGALERYVRSLESTELLFAPGEQWSYSGAGYAVLSDVIAKASGQTFEAYLQGNVIVPLGMVDTLLIVQEGDQPQVTGNHVRGDNGEVVVSDIFPYRRQFAATGPLYSSITDMVRYATAHLNRGELDGKRILSPSAYDVMWEPISEVGIDFGPTLSPAFASYGLGWTLGTIDGHRTAAHFGLDEGYLAAMVLAPDDNVAVVITSNYFDEEEFNLFAWEVAVKAMQKLLVTSPSEPPAAYTPNYEPADCKYPIPVGDHVECGYLTVPEDRSQPDGPAIRLHVVNYKSKSENPAPDPIFVVHGGPGAAGGVINWLWTSEPSASAFRAERDNIYLEYRGSNFSEPAFYCPEMEAEVADLAGISYAEEVTWSASAIRACHDRLVTEGRNLSAYNVIEAAADIADLHHALGYQEFNVYAVSYGTLVAMNLMREHPPGLRSVVLDSVIPPEASVINEGLQATHIAFQALFQACAGDTICDTAYPGLDALFYQVAAQLRENPVETTITDDAGQTYSVSIDDVKFVNYVWNGSWSHNAASVPAGIYQADQGNLQPVAESWLRYLLDRHGETKPGSWATAHGIWYGMQCLHEAGVADVATTGVIYGTIEGDPSTHDWAVATWITDTVAACAYWNAKSPTPNPSREPFSGDIPTLMVVGSLDPNTPAYFSRRYTTLLSQSHFIELPVGHGVILSPCGLNVIAQFLNDPTQAPDASCVDEMKIEWVLPE